MVTSAESESGIAWAGEAKNPRPIKVLVVDHNPILLQGIAVLIRSQPDMKLVGATGGAAEAIALHRETSPDVTVIDLELSAGSRTIIRGILSVEPHARLIGLTTSELDRYGNEALPAGVKAVLAKDRLELTLAPLIRQQMRPDA
jgi:DNA-binding NarL/FixJ family response regulator